MKNDEALLSELKRDPSTIRLYSSRLPGMKKCGRASYSARCPFHSDNNPSFGVFLADGAWLYKCLGCSTSGNVIQFVENFDRITFNEALEVVRAFTGKSWEGQKKRVESTFKPTVERKEKYKTYTLEQYAPLEAKLAENQAAKDWLLTERGISYETARKLHLGFKQALQTPIESLQDVIGKGWIVFPSICNDEVVSMKYRSIARKAFARQPGMATALFNTDTIDVLNTVYLTSGEFDALSLEQAGFHAVSLPSDSIDMTPEMKDILMQSDRIILAGDSDDSGQKVMERLWVELQERSFLLHWPTGVKDANELLKKDPSGFKKTVQALTNVALSQPMRNIYSLAESMLTSGRTNITDHPQRLRFPWGVVDKMAILLPGSVMSLFATNTKMGKTCFVMDLTMYGAMKHGEKVLNYQCELSTDEVSNLATSYLLKKNRNSLAKDDYVIASNKMVAENVHYYVGRDPTLNTVEPVLDLIEAAIKRLGITIVVLDHIHFICRNEANQTQAEANAMQRIKRMAQQYGVKFIVVGQPRKAMQQNKGKVVHITDWKGSETGGSDADAVFAIHRNHITAKDPANPPMDDYEKRTEIHLLGARAKGDGPTFTILQFHGEIAAFVDEVPMIENLETSIFS